MSERTSQAAIPSGAEGARDVVVHAVGKLVIEAVEGLELSSPAYALCLWVGDDTEDFVPASISIGLEVDRTRYLEQGEPEMVWSAADYAIDELCNFSDPSGDAEFSAAARVLLAALQAAGVRDPAYWLMQEAARDLTRQPPLVDVTDDFVAFALASDYLAEPSVLRSAPPDLRRRLVGRGLVREDADFDDSREER